MKRRLGFEGSPIVNSLGRKGGLAFIWRHGLEVEVLSYSRKHILARMEDSRNKTIWFFTGLYGKPKTGKCNITWELLHELQPKDSTPWLVMGDFNEVLYNLEKIGCWPRNEKQMQDI